jgi:hypothetical protein
MGWSNAWVALAASSVEEYQGGVFGVSRRAFGVSGLQ